MRDHIIFVFFGLLTITFVTPVAAGTQFIGTCVDVIDGDTIVVKTEGKLVTVTLSAVDAPELGQPFGDEARSFTSELVFDREATRARIHNSGIGSTRNQYQTQSCDKLLH